MILPVIRRFARKLAGPIAPRATMIESLAMAQVEPPGFELARAGRSFFGGAVGLTGTDVSNGGTAAAATGRAPVATMPTTTAAFLLWNGDNNSAYAVDLIAIAQLSGTAAVGSAICAALTVAAIAKPTAATGYGSFSRSTGGRATKAVWADNSTLATQAPWMVLKGNGNPASTTNGGDFADLAYRPFIIKPGYALAVAVLSGTGTSPLFLGFAGWSEIDTDLE